MMTIDRIMLAKATPLNFLLGTWQSISHSTQDIVLVLGAVVVLSLAFLFWAVFLRKRKKHLSGWHMSHHRSGGSAAGNGQDRHSRRRRRRRRSAHEELPRNPTLAETGGLPRPRTERQSDGIP